MKYIFLITVSSMLFGYSQTNTAIEYNAKGCLWPFYSKDNGKTIADQTEFENAVRQDASRAACFEQLETIDFSKYVLIGNIISSGHCYRPPGLDYTTEYASSSKTLYLNISYQEAGRNAICRAASRYDLWLLIHRPNDDFEVVSRLNPIDANDDYDFFQQKTINTQFHKQVKAFFSYAETREWNQILGATYPKLFDLQPRDKMLQALQQSYDGEQLKMYFSDFKYHNDAQFFKVDSLQFAIADYSSKIKVEFFQNETQTDADFDDYLAMMLTRFGKQYPTSIIKKENNTLIIEGSKQLLGVYHETQKKWTFIELTKTSGQLLNLLFEKNTAAKIIEAARLSDN